MKIFKRHVGYVCLVKEEKNLLGLIINVFLGSEKTIDVFFPSLRKIRTVPENKIVSIGSVPLELERQSPFSCK